MYHYNRETLKNALECAMPFDLLVASETLGDSPSYGCCDFFGSIGEYLRAYEDGCALGEEYAKHLKLCIDTGHSNKAMRFYDNPTPADFIRRVGKDKIAALHLNDNNTLTDQHKMPFSGTIDWNDTFAALDEVGYDGVYNMELALYFYGKEICIETGAFAVKVMRAYLKKRYPQDFAE
jgi:hypothetical protein